MTEPFPPPDDYRLTAGVPLRRAFAWCVDGALIALAVFLLWLALLAFGLLTLGLGLPLLGLLPVVPFAYHALLMSGHRDATPGQRLLGLRVRREADLGPPTLAAALVFTVGLYLTLAAGAVWLVVALVARRHRALHDMASGLIVVRADALPSALTWRGEGWNMPHGYRGT